MPKFREYIKSLEAENARLLEETRNLAHDRYMAETNYQKQKDENQRLLVEIEEWKKTAYHLLGQSIKKSAELFLKDSVVEKQQRGNDEIKLAF